MRKEAIRELAENIHVMSEIDPSEFDVKQPPVVTIYMPIHRSEREGRRSDQDRIEFKNLVKSATRDLQEHWGKDATSGITNKLDYILTHEDLPLWLDSSKGLAFLVDNKDAYVYNMTVAPEAKVEIGDAFDMEQILSDAERKQALRYKLLLLNSDFFAILDGDSDGVHFETLPENVKHFFAETYPEFDGDTSPLDYYSLEDHMSPYHNHKSRKEVTKEEKKKFFRYVDKAMGDYLIKDDPTPVILVTLPEHVHMFREIATFKTLYPKAIEKDPKSMSGAQLKSAAIKLLE